MPSSIFTIRNLAEIYHNINNITLPMLISESFRLPSVADPGCLYWIRIFPFRIQSKKDPHERKP
jgi:hypothetical protein